MNASAARQKLDLNFSIDNLFLTCPDTEFRDFLTEVDDLVRFAPEILTAIDRDLDFYAKEKKRLRLADKEFFRDQTPELVSIALEREVLERSDLTLEIGRPRMPAYLVYVFLTVRGYCDSVTSKEAVTFMKESMSLHVFLQSRGYKMPGATTILENINAVSNATRDLIHDGQIQKIRKDGLDDFRKLLIDSTSVKANSAWPTDAKMILGLLSRVYHLGQKLDQFDLLNFKKSRMPSWLEKLDRLELTINLTSGKANSKGKLKKYYRQVLDTGLKALAHLAEELALLEKRYFPYTFLAPSRRVCLECVIEQMKEDLSDVYKVTEYTSERIFSGKQLKSTEKILSLSDKAAAFIKKGNRNPVIGYKPQLVRSEQGFVTVLLVPEGNAPDALQFVPATLTSISRTGTIPDSANSDDGYASRINVELLHEMGIKIVSISGAKGKKLTSPEDWGSEEYQKTRRDRSAVESLMFVLKYSFDFGVLSRRGLEAVRAELTEKVIAYNFCKIAQLKDRQSKKAA